jgi:filamentous hemagglutinin family protein
LSVFNRIQFPSFWGEKFYTGILFNCLLFAGAIMSKPSLNHTYRLRWNAVKRLWVVVAETAKTRSKKASPCLLLRALNPLFGSLAFGASSLAFAADLPTGAQINSGAASISQNSHSLTVQQHSDKLITNWQSFDIGKNHSVNFIQPGSRSVALNRVLGNDASQIYGQLNANGQVFLINPNGVLFGHSAKVDVGGLVASTLNINDQDFLNGHYIFQGTHQNNQGSITNAGTLSAQSGGAIALLGAKVSNTGLIQAQLGAVALAAGDNITLDFAGDGLLSATINQASLNALVENHGAIIADGGSIVMTADAGNALLQTVVNNTGVVQARTVENRNGKIILLGGFDGGTVQVAGMLDASAPAVDRQGDVGGFIETSGAHVKVADSTKITTKSASGKNGTWLIDPVDFTVAASGGDMTGATLSNALANGDVEIQSTTGGGGVNGDVNIRDTVNWSQNTLTLNAQHDINVFNTMNASGTAGLFFKFNQADAGGNYHVFAPVNLASTASFRTQSGSAGGVSHWTIITRLGSETDVTGNTGTTLQGI